MLKIMLVGHTHDYPLCDVVRLLTGVIPHSEEGCIVAETGFDAVIRSEVRKDEIVTSVEKSTIGNPIDQTTIHTALSGEVTVVYIAFADPGYSVPLGFADGHSTDAGGSRTAKVRRDDTYLWSTGGQGKTGLSDTSW